MVVILISNSQNAVAMLLILQHKIWNLLLTADVATLDLQSCTKNAMDITKLNLQSEMVMLLTYRC